MTAISVAPFLAGYPASVITSPGLKVMRVQPTDLAREIGFVSSPLHRSTFPAPFVTSMEISTCGLIKLNSRTVPVTVTVFDGSQVAEAIRALVSTGLAVHAVAPALHQAFTEQLPDGRARMTAPDEAPMADVRRLLEQAAVDLPDKELALWMIDTVAHAVIHRAAVERPKDLSSELLASELSALLLRYLRRK